MQPLEYKKEIYNIEKFLHNNRYREAGQICGTVFESLLKDLYGQIKNKARPAQVKAMRDVEEKLFGGRTELQRMTLDELVELFSEGSLFEMIEPAPGKPSLQAKDFQLKKLLEIRNRCSISVYMPQADEIQFFYSTIATLLKKTGMLNEMSLLQTSAEPPAAGLTNSENQGVCPNCSEPVRENWKVCPACETSLVQLSCPQCGQPVNANWKLCPECNVRLFCSSCGKRIPDGQKECPECATQEHPPVYTEPVTGMEFVRIPGGSFRMGDTFGEGLDDETPAHVVRVSRFYLGKYPVTQGQWKQVMKTNPSLFKKSDRHPVEQVAWGDVAAFIDALTAMNAGKLKFRLPSEAEWEYAARSGGKDQKFAGGNDADAVAWYEQNSGGSTRAVGQKAPNGLNVYDMSGNVWEWCRDVYHSTAYRYHAEENPVWTQAGPERVIRGGSWNLDSWSVRCARRFGFAADYFGAGLSFRLLLEL